MVHPVFNLITREDINATVCCSPGFRGSSGMNAATFYTELIDWILKDVLDGKMYVVQMVVTGTAFFW